MLKPAQKSETHLRLAIAGPAGSGKTYSSLLIASGMADWNKIVVIDTERASSNCYADLGQFYVIELDPPFKPEKYIAAIKEAEEAGMEVIIIDSLSHAWAGEGGLLDLHGQAADKGKNSFMAWREVTPLHNRLVDTMLTSKAHIIATLRTKTEYVVEEGGKKIRKVGLAPIQRDGLEYEFTIFGDLSPAHLLTISKDRTQLFQDQSFVPDQEMGRKIKSWLTAKPKAVKPAVPSKDEPPEDVTEDNAEPEPTAEADVELVVIAVDGVTEGYAPAVVLDTDEEIVIQTDHAVEAGRIYKITGVRDGNIIKVTTIQEVNDAEDKNELIEAELTSTPKKMDLEVDGETLKDVPVAKAALPGKPEVVLVGDILNGLAKGKRVKASVVKKTFVKNKETWLVSA